MAEQLVLQSSRPEQLSNLQFNHTEKLLYPLTSMITRPSGLPPMVISKKHFGLDIAVLANRRNEKISRARVQSSKGRAE